MTQTQTKDSGSGLVHGRGTHSVFVPVTSREPPVPCNQEISARKRTQVDPLACWGAARGEVQIMNTVGVWLT